MDKINIEMEDLGTKKDIINKKKEINNVYSYRKYIKVFKKQNNRGYETIRNCMTGPFNFHS
tara:strand:+ start:446 stop:628 length:183 start_codon:yes stop_codon:yes gene_type:complete